jgi:hypothetical protein
MLGYSHAITPQLALGLEIGYRYNRMTQNVDEQGSTGGSSGSFSTDQTVTALVARYFF